MLSVLSVLQTWCLLRWLSSIVLAERLATFPLYGAYCDKHLKIDCDKLKCVPAVANLSIPCAWIYSISYVCARIVIAVHARSTSRSSIAYLSIFNILYLYTFTLNRIVPIYRFQLKPKPGLRLDSWLARNFVLNYCGFQQDSIWNRAHISPLFCNKLNQLGSYFKYVQESGEKRCEYL